MAIAGQVFLLHLFTSSSKLGNRTGRSRLGGLAAGVGVNLGIEDQDVNILAGSDNMIQAAEADVVSPAVAAEDPDGFLSEEIFIWRISLAIVGSRSSFQRFDQLFSRRLIGVSRRSR